jgi:hypothetical protein
MRERFQKWRICSHETLIVCHLNLDMSAQLLDGYACAGGAVQRFALLRGGFRWHQRVMCVHAGSFTYIFKPALALGMLSRRQVYEEAMAYERERFKGVEVPQALWCPAAQAAAKGVECGDFHVSLGHLLKDRPTQVPIHCITAINLGCSPLTCRLRVHMKCLQP